MKRLSQRYSRIAQQRGRALRRVAKAFDMVAFGTIHRDDDVTPIHGFTASTTHIDQHFTVGQFDGYQVRFVDRFDTIRLGTTKHHAQTWCIIEISLESKGLPHVCLIPTGNNAQEYQKLFSTHTHLQPLNATLLRQHSTEVHGRFQILGPTSRMNDIERLLTSPLVMGIATKFWPHGVEIKNDTLYVYVTDHRLSVTVVSSALSSALWLAQSLDATVD